MSTLTIIEPITEDSDCPCKVDRVDKCTKNAYFSGNLHHGASS